MITKQRRARLGYAFEIQMAHLTQHTHVQFHCKQRIKVKLSRRRIENDNRQRPRMKLCHGEKRSAPAREIVLRGGQCA
jgi:hypothetical protein